MEEEAWLVSESLSSPLVLVRSTGTNRAERKEQIHSAQALRSSAGRVTLIHLSTGYVWRPVMATFGLEAMVQPEIYCCLMPAVTTRPQARPPSAWMEKQVKSLAQTFRAQTSAAQVTSRSPTLIVPRSSTSLK